MKKRLRTVQPAHWSPNLTPERVRAAWLKTYADLGIEPGSLSRGPFAEEDGCRVAPQRDLREAGG